MKKKDIHTQSPEDLTKIVADMREKNREIRFGAAGSRSRNTRGSRMNRRTIARALTELRMREVAKVEKKA